MTTSYTPDPSGAASPILMERHQHSVYPPKNMPDAVYIPATMMRQEEPGVGEALLGCAFLLLLATLLCLLFYYLTL